MSLLSTLERTTEQKGRLLFVLIDPDHFDEARFISMLSAIEGHAPHAFLLGGSLISGGDFHGTLESIKRHTSIPICLFPGNFRQIDTRADAILFMSLISGRNPDFLIGNQVVAAPVLHNSGIEIIPTGYMLIDGGKITSAHYMSHTLPIPADKPEIAACTALAGQMLGMKCIYMDAGSGALSPISENMISQVRDKIQTPIIVGGGIKDAKTAQQMYQAGATAIVIGNAVESNPKLIIEIHSIL